MMVKKEGKKQLFFLNFTDKKPNLRTVNPFMQIPLHALYIGGAL